MWKNVKGSESLPNALYMESCFKFKSFLSQKAIHIMGCAGWYRRINPGYYVNLLSHTESILKAVYCTLVQRASLKSVDLVSRNLNQISSIWFQDMNANCEQRQMGYLLENSMPFSCLTCNILLTVGHLVFKKKCLKKKIWIAIQYSMFHYSIKKINMILSSRLCACEHWHFWGLE